MRTTYELMIDDIVDLRAYKNEREEFRRSIIELKRDRRIHIGPCQSMVFENRDTIRFQIQEIARAEKIIADAGIESELRVYNPLISRPGKLSATLFLELTADEQLREWLPKLVGIERSYELHLGEGEDLVVIGNEVDTGHEETPTSDKTTASVHHLWWPVADEYVARLAAGPAALVSTHEAYRERVQLSSRTRVSLVRELV